MKRLGSMSPWSATPAVKARPILGVSILAWIAVAGSMLGGREGASLSTAGVICRGCAMPGDDWTGFGAGTKREGPGDDLEATPFSRLKSRLAAGYRESRFMTDAMLGAGAFWLSSAFGGLDLEGSESTEMMLKPSLSMMVESSGILVMPSSKAKSSASTSSPSSSSCSNGPASSRSASCTAVLTGSFSSPVVGVSTSLSSSESSSDDISIASGFVA